jgi:hypothetical protein
MMVSFGAVSVGMHARWSRILHMTDQINNQSTPHRQVKQLITLLQKKICRVNGVSNAVPGTVLAEIHSGWVAHLRHHTDKHIKQLITLLQKKICTINVVPSSS